MSKTHAYGRSGFGFGNGQRNLDWECSGPSLSPPLCWKRTSFLMAFTDCGLKAKCTILCSPFSFYHSPFPPPAPTLFSPLFHTSPIARQNPLLDALSGCRLFRYSTHRNTHSHCNIAHPRGRGTGPKCLMLWFQGDSVTAAEGRNRCASLRLN